VNQPGFPNSSRPSTGQSFQSAPPHKWCVWRCLLTSLRHVLDHGVTIGFYIFATRERIAPRLCQRCCSMDWLDYMDRKSLIDSRGRSVAISDACFITCFHPHILFNMYALYVIGVSWNVTLDINATFRFMCLVRSPETFCRFYFRADIRSALHCDLWVDRRRGCLSLSKPAVVWPPVWKRIGNVISLLWSFSD